jgi:hypothetical protein
MYLCGGAGFRLEDGKLVVKIPGRGDNLYDLSKIIRDQWFQLKDSRGDLLSIYLIWKYPALRINVGKPPQTNIPVLGVSDRSQEWQFQVNLDGAATKRASFSHPALDIKIVLATDLVRYAAPNSRLRGPLVHVFQIHSNLSGLYFEQVLELLPERKWLVLTHPKAGKLPIKVFKDKKRVQVEWLPPDA